MSEMIERVARAMHTAVQEDGAEPWDFDAPDRIRVRQAYLAAARAAIAAMREPTEGMKRIGTGVVCGVGDDKYWADGPGAYEAMLDAALAEEW